MNAYCAIGELPRHLFVPQADREDAYADHPLPVGCGQTISQPYIVALMTELLHLSGDEKVLEVGTGSGYQAALLGRFSPGKYTPSSNIRNYLSARRRSSVV